MRKREIPEVPNSLWRMNGRYFLIFAMQSKGTHGDRYVLPLLRSVNPRTMRGGRPVGVKLVSNRRSWPWM